MFSAFHHGFRIALGLTMAVSFFLFTSCIKKETFPDIPEIAYLGFTSLPDSGKAVTTGILTISFKDGNGDIGLNPGDTLPPFNKNGNYYYNYVIDYYEKQMGTYVKITLDPPYNARIPYLTPDDPNKSIKGYIVDTLQLNPKPLYDTIKFKFYIYDRALNKSNVDSTPPIILRRP